MDCKYAVDELGESLAKCYETAFEAVVTQYDGILAVIEHEKSMLDEYIAQSEAQGYITSSKYYEALITNEEKNIEELGNKKNNLLAQLQEGLDSGAIEEGSEAWYDMMEQINDVTLSIEKGETAIIKYGAAIKDIEWNVFTLLQDNISSIAKEANFLIDLMSNKDLHTDKGQLTNEGKATMGLHAQNYNTYMAQADDYAEKIKENNEELAKDPYNKDLIDKKKELYESQQSCILAAEDEKQAIIDMVRDGIELELDAMQELIDTYEEALDSQKSLYDYQKKVAEQTKNIADLEKQMSAYANDTSEEAKAKIQQIKVSLEDAKDNLEETQYDQYISDTKQLLDELYIEYESILNQRFDNIDGLIGEMITTVNNNSGVIATTIYSAADKVGYTLSTEMQGIWGEAYEKAQTENQQRVDQTNSVLNQLVANGTITQDEADNIMSALGKGDAQSALNTLNLINQMVANGAITQDEGNSIITALSLGDKQQVSDSLKILNQLAANGTITQDESDQIISALVTGDTEAVNNAGKIVGGLVANGELDTENASKIISGLSGVSQEEAKSALDVVKKLSDNGAITEEEAGTIVGALASGDEEAVNNATGIVSQLASDGKIAQEDANTIISALNSSLSQNDDDDVVSPYDENFDDGDTTINKTLTDIEGTLDKMLQELTEMASSNIGDASNSSSSNKTPSNSSSNSSSSNKTSTKTRTEKEYYGVALAIWNGNYGWGTGSTRSNRLKKKGFDASKVQTIVNQMGKDGYVHSGKWSGKYHGIKDLSPYHYNKFAKGVHNLNKDQLAWTQENGLEMVVRPSDGAILTPLAKTDSVLKASASDNIWDMANNPSEFIKDNLKLDGLNTPINQNVQSNYSQNLEQVIFNMPNVKNYEELLSTMQHDKNFERLIMSMTIDRMVGKTSLAKGKSIR